MISVIIPAYNCVGEIGALLDDVSRTRLGEREEFEILVVDDGSTDGTPEACAGRPRVRVLCQPQNAGPARARNVGAAAARGDVLVFCDSDVRLPETGDVLADMVAAFREHPEVDCVSTVSDVQPRIPGAIAYNTSIYHAYYMARFLGGRDERKDRVMFFTTRLGGIRAERFRAAGGFQDALTTVMNEDGEFGARVYELGYTSYFHEKLVNHHRYPTKLDRFVRSYFLTAMVQAMIDRTYDTTPDESISPAEKLRRLYALTAFGLPALPLVVGPFAALGLTGGWAAGFLASFGAMLPLVLREVPPRTLLPFFGVYIGVTPVILAGYAWGLLRHALGGTLLRDPPSELDWFARGGEEPAE